MNTNIEEQYSILPFFKKFEEVLKRKVGAKKEPVILLQGGFGKHNTCLLYTSGEKISLAFNLDEDTNNIEFRIYGYAGCNAQFKNIKLIKNM